MHLFVNIGVSNIQGTHKSAMNITVMQSSKSLKLEIFSPFD